MQTSAPFGFRPAWHLFGGQIHNDEGTIASLYNSNIFMGSPVGFIADGTIALAAAAGTGATGTVGAFAGVQYTAVAGQRPTVSNLWPASTAATDIKAYFTTDPGIVYEVQANATLTRAAIGGCYDHSTNDTNAGDTTTGISTVTLNVASAANPATWQVVGLTESPLNAWGDSYPVVNVRLAESQFGAGATGF
jgi:hypothetical protein